MSYREVCTSNAVAPVLDTIFAGGQVVRTVFAAKASQSVYDDPKQPISREGDIALGLAFTTLFLSSAIYGFHHTAVCRERRAEWPEPQADAPLQPSASHWSRHRVGVVAPSPDAPPEVSSASIPPNAVRGPSPAASSESPNAQATPSAMSAPSGAPPATVTPSTDTPNVPAADSAP